MIRRNSLGWGASIALFVSVSTAAPVGVRGLLGSDPWVGPSGLLSRGVRSDPPSEFAPVRRWKNHGVRFARPGDGNGDDKDNGDYSSNAPSSPRVQFSGTDDDPSSSLANPLDRLLTLVASDAFSIGAGILGLLAVVVYRWNLVLADSGRAAAEALTYQTRTDLLAVLASGSVLLNGVTKLDVTTALAESVVLEGTTLPEPELADPAVDGGGSTLAWALESLLSATPAKTAVLLADVGDRWSVRCRTGVVPSSRSVPEKTPILERVGAPGNSKETYLPTLQALPGRTELTYLPSNTQMAVLIPIRPASSSGGDTEKNSILVLGGNTAKSFTPRDIAWSRIVAEKLGEDL